MVVKTFAIGDINNSYPIALRPWKTVTVGAMNKDISFDVTC